MMDVIFPWKAHLVHTRLVAVLSLQCLAVTFKQHIFNILGINLFYEDSFPQCILGGFSHYTPPGGDDLLRFIFALL